ncbi:MAG TPA: acyl-CoA thioesterase [candidate division Zixibacteria bacterium]|nr:acyl-CoA thioesterase [candidate division Zixibacteria bacterium]
MSDIRAKKPSDSEVVMTELAIPNDSNILGNVLGGRVMHWMDLSAAMAAHKHCNSICVTASIEGMSFYHPIKVGQLALLRARVVYTGRTSLITKVIIHSEDMDTGEKLLTTEAYMTFVCLDKNGKPRKIPSLILETDQEKAEYAHAEEIRRRKQEIRKQEK